MDECFYGCWQEARRADKVAALLARVRTALEPEFYENISAVVRETESASRLLRDLYDLFPIYRSRVPVVNYYLNIILPSLQRTMMEMLVYVEHKNLSPRLQWTLMSKRLGDQGGTTIAQRLVMYCDALIQTVRLLSRSPLYDPTSLELLRVRHMRLRKLQNIPDPQVAVVPHRAPPQPSQAELERRHWAEKIFDDVPHSSTGLRHRRVSKCFGPPMVDFGIPPGSTVLFKIPFDKNHLSVTLYLHADGADVTRLLCRWMDRYFNPMYSCYGVHELCVERKGSSLQFRRWSSGRAHSKVWMALFFKTWERMVLFHAAFVALKARCPLTISVHPEDYALSGEKMLFRAQIIDDGFEHSLAVMEDRKSHGLRLHAAVWNGELRRCPVWTAFVTYVSASPEWLFRKSGHRVWLKDIQPYVFCANYKKRRQMRGKGDFEIYFVDRVAADAFEDIFREESDVDSIMDVPVMAGGAGPGPGP